MQLIQDNFLIIFIVLCALELMDLTELCLSIDFILFNHLSLPFCNFLLFGLSSWCLICVHSHQLWSV